MVRSAYPKNVFAAGLFDDIAKSYEGPARLLSLGQYDRWHRFLVSRLQLGAGERLLDVATGTGLVAERASEAWDCEVVGMDLSAQMIVKALARTHQENQGHAWELLRGRAEDLPFTSGAFDGVVFTYLLRYVEDPGETIRELVRVLRPGGVLASLEFAVPRGPILRPLWLAHTRMLMPIAGRLLGQGWARTTRFLGPSISDFYHRYPLDDLIKSWREAGVPEVSVQLLSLGGAVVMWGRKG